MKTVFIYEDGIYPWDQGCPSDDKDYITLTLLNHTLIEVWPSWCKLELLLMKTWPIVVSWGTFGIKPYSKTQEYLALKSFSKKAGPGDTLKKNEATSIYSYIKYINTPATKVDPSTLGSTRGSVRLMKTPNSETTDLWQKLSALDYISTTDDFRLILSDNATLSIRFFNGETYGAIQLICHSKHKKTSY
ncbi:hypothetical protein FQ186_27125 [Pseudomonas sp. ANT_H14]|uniref:hypothetical protein n=1 Tax=unclassified Pseudomonas TaxID=196821 RepID=UPI0011EEF6E7|nr:MULTISPECIES: hypothetical protein [unclassified Pseudomonas]KAA0941715.1 hypothetical protein FQ182_28675 [Pseudomonas sp. ANT_H4]KAA0946449.1 hypothetical protein FQ186_27125 [Pseudomonas sp. ANT_H14]